jgi:hypothetical protein
MDLGVKAIDERINSVFRGLLQNGFRTLNFFVWCVCAMSSAYWNKFKEDDLTSDIYRLNNIGAKMLPCGKPLFNRHHLLLWFPSNTWKKRFDRILFSRLEIFEQGTVVINFNVIYWGRILIQSLVGIGNRIQWVITCSIQLRCLRNPA